MGEKEAENVDEKKVEKEENDAELNEALDKAEEETKEAGIEKPAEENTEVELDDDDKVVEEQEAAVIVNDEVAEQAEVADAKEEEKEEKVEEKKQNHVEESDELIDCPRALDDQMETGDDNIADEVQPDPEDENKETNAEKEELQEDNDDDDKPLNEQVNNAEPDDILELEVDDTESLIDSDDPLAQSPHVWLSNLNVATKAADIQAAVNAELGDEALKGCKVVKSKKSAESCFAFCTVGSGVEARKLVKLFNRHVLTILRVTIEAKQVESDPTAKKKPETKKNVSQPEEQLTKASTVPKRSSQKTPKKKVET